MTIRIYAPGDGSLAFVRCDEKGKACAPHRITLEEANRAIIEKGTPYEDYRLIMAHGEPLLIPEVRYDPAQDVWLYKGRDFTRITKKWFILEHDDNMHETWEVVRNSDEIAALDFFAHNLPLYGAGVEHA